MRAILESYFRSCSSHKSYKIRVEIIIKAHGGEIKVETKEGEYTNFIILLPAQNLLIFS